MFIKNKCEKRQTKWQTIEIDGSNPHIWLTSSAVWHSALPTHIICIILDFPHIHLLHVIAGAAIMMYCRILGIIIANDGNGSGLGFVSFDSNGNVFFIDFCFSVYLVGSSSLPLRVWKIGKKWSKTPKNHYYYFSHCSEWIVDHAIFIRFQFKNMNNFNVSFFLSIDRLPCCGYERRRQFSVRFSFFASFVSWFLYENKYIDDGEECWI